MNESVEMLGVVGSMGQKLWHYGQITHPAALYEEPGIWAVGVGGK